jgi:tetratricopeptide (TPR) repeat protein
MKILLTAIVAAALISADVIAAPLGDGRSAFESGTKAFRAGNYETALDAFLKAEAAGLKTANLHYNLGATYFKLGRYSSAKQAFERLLGHEPYGALAHYNLGLIARAQSDEADAIRHFSAAHANASDYKLKRLAAIALETVKAEAVAETFSGIAELGGGYDSNASLGPDLSDLQGPASAFGQFFVGGRLLLPEIAQGLILEASTFGRLYADDDGFDQLALRTGLTHTQPIGTWRATLSAYGEGIWIDRSLYQTGIGFKAAARGAVTVDLWLEPRYSAVYYDPDDSFDYLRGWQQSLGVEATYRPAGLSLGYVLELNDRADFEQNGERVDYSPTRHLVSVQVRRPLSPVLTAQARLTAGSSEYSDANVVDGSSTVRDDRTTSFNLRLERVLDSRWSAFGEYTYTDNGSNIDSYDYQRHEASVGIGARF